MATLGTPQSTTADQFFGEQLSVAESDIRVMKKEIKPLRFWLGFIGFFLFTHIAIIVGQALNDFNWEIGSDGDWNRTEETDDWFRNDTRRLAETEMAALVRERDALTAEVTGLKEQVAAQQQVGAAEVKLVDALAAEVTGQKGQAAAQQREEAAVEQARQRREAEEEQQRKAAEDQKRVSPTCFPDCLKKKREPYGDRPSQDTLDYLQDLCIIECKL